MVNFSAILYLYLGLFLVFHFHKRSNNRMHIYLTTIRLFGNREWAFISEQACDPGIEEIIA